MPRSALAWCPGGRTTAKAWATGPAITASMVAMAPPAANLAIRSDSGPIAVSPVESSWRPALMSACTCAR